MTKPEQDQPNRTEHQDVVVDQDYDGGGIGGGPGPGALLGDATPGAAEEPEDPPPAEPLNEG
ncbi:hypothetical protein [Deinococcus planocerae]|uniref:hypothetical protein n=1 Tax=Deinococcus planocerae TaxID=1737569 RepID=UPI0015E0A862|nr:hypothetical protein [Deinococcus planocerae]